MSVTAKLTLGAAKVIRILINLLAEGEANLNAPPENREAYREARMALYLAFFAERDESGKIVYEHRDSRSSRGIAPYDPREGSKQSKPPEKIRKIPRVSPPSNRRIDVAVTHRELEHPANLTRKSR